MSTARPFYRTVYHRNDWRLADAFRPQPGWGTRVFTASVASLPPHSEPQLVQIAKEAAPHGYRLTSLSIFPEQGEERVIWATEPDQRMKLEPSHDR